MKANESLQKESNPHSLSSAVNAKNLPQNATLDKYNGLFKQALKSVPLPMSDANKTSSSFNIKRKDNFGNKRSANDSSHKKPEEDIS
jgi:hypothetical protein